MSANNAQDNGKYKFVARYGEAIVRGGIAAIPYALYRYQGELKLTVQQVWFISSILSHKWDADMPYPSLRLMAEKTGVAEKRLHAYKNELKEKGWLIIINRKTTKGGKDTNFYDFTALFTKLVELLERDKEAHESRDVTSSTDTHLPLREDTHLPYRGDTYLPPREEHIETVEKETISRNIDNSNIRKLKKAENDGDSSQGSEQGSREGLKPEGRNGRVHTGSSTANNGKAVQAPNLSKRRNVEEVEAQEKYRRSVAQLYVNTPNGLPPGFASVGDTITQQYKAIVTADVSDEEVREILTPYVRKAGVDLHDKATVKSSTTQALNIYKQAGLPIGEFIGIFTFEQAKAKDRKKGMAYFFACLREAVGQRTEAKPQAKGSMPN